MEAVEATLDVRSGALEVAILVPAMPRAGLQLADEAGDQRPRVRSIHTDPFQDDVPDVVRAEQVLDAARTRLVLFAYQTRFAPRHDVKDQTLPGRFATTVAQPQHRMIRRARRAPKVDQQRVIARRGRADSAHEHAREAQPHDLIAETQVHDCGSWRSTTPVWRRAQRLCWQADGAGG